ncbi:restriction endonuclease subunit S [Priestia flexa]|uniref:restriction endonuclease subunit S n=1 Tax=Priestia flexa TaxID=86664 RepID=UPI00099CEBEE|nr:restriction endonuclease subunit S [Priestia flexa]AQX52857.1 hypothetical protein BC359_00090 [Priestia flexa]
MGFKNWYDKRLGEIITLKRGYDLPLKERNKGSYPILSSSGISDYHNEFKVKGPGVTTGRSGLLGKVYFINEPFWPLNTSLYVEDFKDNDPKFIYYLLQTLELENFNAGSSVPTLNRNHVHLLEVKIPDVNYQIRIGEFLYNFEEKISLNEIIIFNLEQLAQTLFKRWFVDFEFPNENGEPYKSSGGEMVESELGMIPKGWNVSELKEIAKHSKKTFNPKKVEPLNVAHFSLPAFDQQEYPITENSETIKSNKYYINENSLLFSKMNPSTPRIWLPNINSDISNVCSTEFVVLDTSYKKNKSFVYSLIKSNEFTIYLKNNATGSTNSRQRVSPTTAIAYKLSYSEEIVNEYEKFITPLLDKILVLREENQNLISLRDTLLPKLLSGEIELPDETEVTDNVPIS